MRRHSVVLPAVIFVMEWAVLVAGLAILGVWFGWRVAVAVTVAIVLSTVRLATGPPDPGRLRTTIEFLAFALVGMGIGIFALGGVGGVFGFTTGVVVRLAEMPTTGVFRSRKRPNSGSR